MSIVLHKCETELIRIETNGIDVLKVNVMAMRLRRADPPGGGFNRVLAEDEDSSPGGYNFLTKRCDMSGDCLRVLAPLPRSAVQIVCVMA